MRIWVTREMPKTSSIVAGWCVSEPALEHGGKGPVDVDQQCTCGWLQ